MPHADTRVSDHVAWQQFLRTLYPAKPVSLDIIWVLERRRDRAEAAEA